SKEIEKIFEVLANSRKNTICIFVTSKTDGYTNRVILKAIESEYNIILTNKFYLFCDLYEFINYK
ncbi:7388_t:CDS:1, partial [Scutellospora calospora]